MKYTSTVDEPKFRL